MPLVFEPSSSTMSSSSKCLSETETREIKPTSSANEGPEIEQHNPNNSVDASFIGNYCIHNFSLLLLFYKMESGIISLL